MSEFIYPVPFDDFVGYRRKQSQAITSTFNIKQLSKIRKLKKLLQTTEQKICNRIKLFKKVSNDIHKKKEKQNLHLQRIQQVKKHHQHESPRRDSHGDNNYLRTTKSSALAVRNRLTNEQEKVQHSYKRHEQIIQEKNDNAKQIKMWKQRNKIIVEQRKMKQMREKVKSANIIRSHRNKAKQIKMQYEQERLEEARKQKELKFKEQIQKYDELQMNLTRLQRQEREALIMWKQAMEQYS